MARVHFTPVLSRHLTCPPRDVPAGPLRCVLDAVFDENPRLRGYILDDQGAIRHHVQIFVDGDLVGDRVRLTDRVRDESEIYVMQALSGG